MNQAVKGTIQARQLLAGEGEDLVILRSGNTIVEGNNTART